MASREIVASGATAPGGVGAPRDRRTGGEGKAAPDACARVAADLAVVLRRAGIHDALGELNARVRHRFTGVYRFAPPLLHNAHLFDRENPCVALSGGVHELDQTYCGLVRAMETPFATADAPRDPRLVAHAARTTVLSYCGVPIRRRSGALLGVLCHHDPRPRLTPAGEIAVLERLAPLLADWLETSPGAS